ncbi:P-loop NTPase fold protein [uncultured Pseudomonas sp.]|uniref:P-loop NTPase fold protein n=1 Tax=uncultured Pseudomonas sp. TaxID=114707 RepID=UPI002583348C|nr:P-loop NTPase fold protein [uncultured Pseudomonas sp.]
MTALIENSTPFQYLEKYIKQESAPGFCVLLTGPWGAGKTYFIKSFQEIFKNENKFLYVSLNGIQSTDQINDEFYRLLNPKLGGKTVSIAGSLIRQGIKAGAKIEIDNKTMKQLKSHLSKHSNHILIFDDLERCEIQTEELFGFINKFAEHNSAKIILIANEQELEKHKTYNAIKEKLIGVTLELQTSPLAVIDDAANGATKKIGELIQRAKPSIIEIFEKSKYRNLRSIKQSFTNFEISFGNIDQEYYQKSDLLEKLLCIYLIFSIEIRSGRLTAGKIGSLRATQMSYVMSQATKQKPDEEVPLSQLLITKYTSEIFQDRVLPDSFWEKLFARGYLPSEDIIAAIRESSYYHDTNSPNWMKLWEMYRMGDAAFNELRDIVKEQFDKREIEELHEALHISGLMLHLSRESLISETKEVILAKAKKILCQLKEKKQLPEKETMDPHHSDFTSYNGLGYMDRETNEFKKLAQFASKMIDRQYEENLPKRLSEILENMSTSTAFGYHERYALVANQLKPFELTPLLHLSDAKIFCKNITKHNETIIPTCTALHDRYKSDYHARSLTTEIHWLKALRDELTHEARLIERTISKSMIRSAIQHQIDPAIAKLEAASR